MSSSPVFLQVSSLQDLASEVWSPLDRRVALSGGSSSRLLSLESPYMSEWDCFLVDERVVSYSSPWSNSRLILESFHILPQSFCMLRTDLPHEDMISDYESRFSQDEEGFLWDRMILGVGNDFHTASLFLGSTELSSGQYSFVIEHADVEPPLRWSLSLESLLLSRFHEVLLIGSKKKDLFLSLQSGSAPADSAISKLLSRAQNIRVWWVEQS